MNQRITILIVDDQPLGQETVASLLSPGGYQLMFASNGPEALQVATATPPDLILLDVMMPGMDGYEVCRLLRNSALLAEVPVIMLTALDDRNSRLRGIEAGADDFVSKPYDRVELQMRVRTITRLNRYRRLMSERSKFEWVVEHADDGYLVVAADGTISYANPRARLYFGVQLEGHFDATFFDLATSQYHLEPATSWDEWFGSSTGAHAAPRILRSLTSGTANSFMLHVELLDMAPDPHCLVRLRDITAMLSNQTSMWSFQGLIRHKLNTALSQLIGAMQVIEELDLAPTEGLFAEMFSIATASTSRLHADISDILQYVAAPDSLRSEHARCTIMDLSTIIADINAHLAITTLQVQEVSNDVLSTDELAISCHGFRLIFSELLENARKFHPRKDPTIDISITHHEDAIEVHILDDGLTLAPDQLTRVWLPYYQGERVFTGQIPGMGLGLPLVANLLWQIGGACRMSNRVLTPGLDIEIWIPFAKYA